MKSGIILVLIGVVVAAYPLAASTKDTATVATVEHPAHRYTWKEYVQVRDSLAKGHDALVAVDGVIRTLKQKLDKLKTEAGTAPSEAQQYLIDKYEEKVEGFVAQKAGLSRQVAALEGTLEQMRADAMLAPEIEDEEREQKLQQEIGNAQQALRGIPTPP